MKKTLPLALLLGISAITLTGCGKRINYDLPADPISFNTTDFTNPANKEDTYRSMELNGRTYLPYGTVKTSINGDDIGKCIGYIVQDDTEMKDVRVFLLNQDSDTNYLAEIEIKGEMSQPTFWRATDTAGKSISTPDYIESLEYDYWK